MTNIQFISNLNLQQMLHGYLQNDALHVFTFFLKYLIKNDCKILKYGTNKHIDFYGTRLLSERIYGITTYSRFKHELYNIDDIKQFWKYMNQYINIIYQKQNVQEKHFNEFFKCIFIFMLKNANE